MHAENGHQQDIQSVSVQWPDVKLPKAGVNRIAWLSHDEKLMTSGKQQQMVNLATILNGGISLGIKTTGNYK